MKTDYSYDKATVAAIKYLKYLKGCNPKKCSRDCDWCGNKFVKNKWFTSTHEGCPIVY